MPKLIFRALALLIIGCAFIPLPLHHRAKHSAAPQVAAAASDRLARASRSYDRPPIDVKVLKAMQARREARVAHQHLLAHLRAVRLAQARAMAAAVAARQAAIARAQATPAPTYSQAPTYAAPAYSSSGHNWDGVAQCESGGNWHINTGNGYYGGLQFSLSTWHSMGGSGLPSDASRETQIAIAERTLAAVHGNWQSQWPVCGRYL